MSAELARRTVELCDGTEATIADLWATGAEQAARRHLGDEDPATYFLTLARRIEALFARRGEAGITGERQRQESRPATVVGGVLPASGDKPSLRAEVAAEYLNHPSFLTAVYPSGLVAIRNRWLIHRGTHWVAAGPPHRVTESDVHDRKLTVPGSLGLISEGVVALESLLSLQQVGGVDVIAPAALREGPDHG